MSQLRFSTTTGTHAGLHEAARLGDLDSVVAAVKHADVTRRDKTGCTALHWACKGGHTEVVAALLSANAYVNELDKSGCTPLSYCAAWNSKDVAQLLLSCGASVNKADTHGKTPLMWASHEGHLAMARLLLAHGADTEAQDAQGRTAADIAYAQGHHKVEQLLLKGQRYFGSSPQEKQVARKSVLSTVDSPRAQVPQEERGSTELIPARERSLSALVSTAAASSVQSPPSGARCICGRAMTVSSGAAERRAMRAEALAMSLQGKLATAQTELGVVRAQLKELQGEAAAMVAVEHRCSALKGCPGSPSSSYRASGAADSPRRLSMPKPSQCQAEVSSRRRSSAARPLSTSTCHDTQAADDVSSNASALHADTSLHSDRLSLSKKLDFAMRTSRAESLGATQSVASERRHAAVLKGTSRRDTATALSSLRSGMTVAGDLLLDSPGSRARAPAEKHRGTARLSSLAGCAHDGAVDATAHSEEKCSPADSAASEVGDGGCGTCQTTGDSRTSSSGAHKVTSAQRQVPIVRRCVTMCGMLMAVACVLLAIVAIPLMAIDGPAHRPRVSLLPIDVPFAQAPPLTKATTSAQPVHKERCWLWCRLWRLFQ